MKLLRSVRLDASDTFIFTRAADDEWVVSGAFMFWDRPVETLTGKERAAFRSGLLGVSSLGWSTLAVVREASEEDRQAAVLQLAHRLVEHLGAPDLPMATAAAEQEIAFAETLAEPAAGTLVAVHRTFEQGEIREKFRTLLVGGDSAHYRPFQFEVEEDASEERVDLMALRSGE